MVTKPEYIQQRRKAAEALAEFNRKACIHFAEVLRTQDAYERLSRELGIKPEELIPKQAFEIVYRVLTFGKGEDRATLMMGNAEAIESLLYRVETERGFYDETGFFIEI